MWKVLLISSKSSTDVGMAVNIGQNVYLFKCPACKSLLIIVCPFPFLCLNKSCHLVQAMKSPCRNICSLGVGRGGKENTSLWPVVHWVHQVGTIEWVFWDSREMWRYLNYWILKGEEYKEEYQIVRPRKQRISGSQQGLFILVHAHLYRPCERNASFIFVPKCKVKWISQSLKCSETRDLLQLPFSLCNRL